MHIVFICNNINTRVFTPYSTMIKTRKINRVLLPIQSNRFLYNLATSFRTLPFSHALSTTHTTLCLPSISCHPSTISFINLTISFLYSARRLQCRKKCSAFSTSPLSHILQIGSSLLNPHHLPVSILNSAVPSHSFIGILLFLLQLTLTHLASHLRSINLPVTSNFGRTLASSLHPS